MRACWRLLRAFLHVLKGLWICSLYFPQWPHTQRMQATQDWAQKLLQVMGVDLQVIGTPVEGPVLLVSNHISWIDIFVINAVQPARFVSKADVKQWPLIGTLVTNAGTLFIEREKRRDAMRVVHHLAESLNNGDVVAVFPEGTTGDGHALLPFHGNLLQAAIVTQHPVLPVVMRYRDAQQNPSRAVAWLGEETLMHSLWKIATAQNLQVRLRLADVQHAQGRDRRQWSHDLHAMMTQLLIIH